MEEHGKGAGVNDFSYDIVAGLNVLYTLNVHHIIAYPGLCFVMQNMIALMGKMNDRIVKVGHVQTYLGAQNHLYVYILLQFVIA